MKKTLLVVIVTALLATGASATQPLIRPNGTSQSLTFNDLGLGGGDATHGSYAPGSTFSFDVNLTFQGYNSTGLSFWLETVTAFAGSLSITGVTYGTVFPDATQSNPNPAFFNASSGATPGNLTETRDLGSTLDPQGPSAGPGTYLVAHITFSIAAGATPGSYILQSTTALPHTSEVTSFDGTNFADNNLPAAQYFITIIPEPTTLALIGLTAVGGAIIAHRRRVLRG